MSDFRSTRGASRERLSDEALERAAGSVVEDARRTRTLFFDGRFLAAGDLTRDQNYFLARQSDLGMLGGTGVAHGLSVSTDGTGRRLLVQPGHGVTPSGELVMLRDTADPGDPPRAIEVDLANLAAMERLDAVFGLSRSPRAPARNRSGLFVVALRPVEYTAHPIAQYPTSLHDRRPDQLRDGDIIEAAAISLIPFDADPQGAASDDRRARAAQAIFFHGRPQKLPIDALPLAVVGMTRGVIDWVDNWLVRREIGGTTTLGFGLAHRSVREAFLRQHDAHLSDVAEDRSDAGRSPSFAASEHFLTLPAAGRLPDGVVVARETLIEQTYFPPEVDVDLQIVPEDELAALLEDALPLPPIDLGATPDALESVYVSVLIPLPRGALGALKQELGDLRRRLTRDPGERLLRLRPLLALRSLRRIRVAEEAPPAGEDLILQAWARELSQARERGTPLWYVRRRNLPQSAEVVARARAFVEEPEPPPNPPRFEELVERAGEMDIFRRVMEVLDARNRTLVARFAAERLPIFEVPLAVSGFVGELGVLTGVVEGPGGPIRAEIIDRPIEVINPIDLERGAREIIAPRADRAAQVEAVTGRWMDRGLPRGLVEAVRLTPPLDELENRRLLARAVVVPELDARCRALQGAELTSLLRNVFRAVQRADIARLRVLLVPQT